MKILIFGAGAMGSAFGGFLAKAGHEVTLVGRSWHMQAIRQKGLKIRGIWGTHCVKSLHVATRLTPKLCRESWDYVLVTVKNFDTEEAVKQLHHCVRSKTQVISIQNGLGNLETLQKYLPQKNILAARVIFGVELAAGQIKITVTADDSAIGELKSGHITPRIRHIAKLWTEAGITTRPVKDIHQVRWAKVIYNCALNPLASLLEVPYGQLMDSPQTREVMRQLVQEAYHVGRAHGVRLKPSSAKGYVDLLFGQLIPSTAAHHPSMLQDLQRGRPTEIDALCGAICQLARQKKISTPYNALMTYLVKAKEVAIRETSF